MATKKVKDVLLEEHLRSDLKLVGLPVDFTFDFRGYSKSYYGKYEIAKKTIIIYILDKKGNKLPYDDILITTVHEALHHYQHNYEEGFKRLHGVMHNPTFKTLEKTKLDTLLSLGILDSIEYKVA